MFDISVDGFEKLLGVFKELEQTANTPAFRQAMVDSAIMVEAKAKENLQEMVYNEPEGWYPREAGRGGLIGKTIASSKVEEEGGLILIGVKTESDYAVYVHFGTGVYAQEGDGRKTPWIFKDEEGVSHWTIGHEPHPYLTKALTDCKEDIIKILSDGVRKSAEDSSKGGI